MPEEFTPEEHEILSEAPADSPTRVGGDSENPTSPTGAAGDDNNLPDSQRRQPADGGREEAQG